MKAIKLIFKTMLILVLLLFISVVGLAYYGIHHPEKVWAIIETRFLPKDLKVTWDSLKFAPNPQSSRLWSPQVDFVNLCVIKGNPEFNFCFDELQVQGLVSLKQIFHPDFEVSNLYGVSNHENYFKPNPEKEKKEEPESNFYEMARAWQQKLNRYSHLVTVRKVELAINQFELRSDKQEPMVFRALVRGAEFQESFATDFILEKKSSSLSLRVNGQMTPGAWFREDGEFADLKIEMRHPKVHLSNSHLSLQASKQGIIASQIEARMKLPQATLVSRLNAELNKNTLHGDLKASVLGLKKPLESLKPIVAQFSIPQETGKMWPQKESVIKAQALMPVVFVDAKMRPQLEKACRCQIPEEIKLDVEASAFLRRYFKDQNGELFDVQAHLESLTNSLFSTQTKANAKISREQGAFKISPFVDSQVKVNSFRGLAVFLRSQKILVPAPLASLEGTLVLTTRGPVESTEENWKFPFNFQSDLKSEDQVVDVGSNGSVDIQTKSKLIVANVDVLLKSVVLQLPPLDPIFGVPKITPDRRIEVQPPKVEKQQKQKAGYKLQLAVHIHSQQPESVRFLYPLAKPSIPLNLNVTYQSGSPIQGTVSSGNFDVDYLKRRSTVENLNITMNDPEGNFPLKGRFRVDENPYRIYIDVLGNIKNPHIVLSSDPYLDRADIISVLLYGRTNDQLVGVDANTVGSFDAAMADRAIGLIGLWAFASTPIQSFSYNQLSRQYSAQLKVSKDTTLAVGTNWEEATSLELQRRLSDHWIVSASLEPNAEEQQTRKIRLQWEDRF